MTENQYKELTAPFPYQDIRWRILRVTEDKRKGLVTPYADARAIQDRLDCVLGPENWQSDFLSTPASGKEPGGHICCLRIFYPEKNIWITKSDGAGSTQVEPIKGGISDAFKRASSAWGIGRYLYQFQPVWIDMSGKAIADTANARLAQAYAAFLAKTSDPLTTVPPSKSPTPFQRPAASSGQPQRPAVQRTGDDVYQISNVTVYPGGKQTFVELRRGDGQTLTGFIRGSAALQRGQKIRDVHISTKEDPTAGRFHIIESFKAA